MSARAAADRLLIPTDRKSVTLRIDGRDVRLTNLKKPFWPDLGITKGGLLQYYADIAHALLPHIVDRAMVMRRYPNGWQGKSFFMKRAPEPRPEWIEVCTVEHGSGNVIDFPMIQDLPALLWVINLGCIDLNPWYARCDDVDRPDYLHFDLDPVPGADWRQVLDAALAVRDALEALEMPCYPKTTGSRGIHVYVPIVRGPAQRSVWAFAKEFARAVAKQWPDLLTAEYRVAKRPEGRVLVDYNQNAWGQTLASVYSVRPRAWATVSAPLAWSEVERSVSLDDFDVFNMSERVADVGDLWASVTSGGDRFDLERYLV
jgi:bifunctional non-homologous end joining protein LigD